MLKKSARVVCDRRRGIYGFEYYLLPRKGSDNLKRENYMPWKESTILEDGFEGGR